MPSDYDALMELVREVGVLSSVQELIEWDQETYMPAGGVAARSEQLAALAKLGHERLTQPRIGELLDRIGDGKGEGEPIRQANIRESRRAYDQAVKVPSDLVARLARATSVAQQAWAAARAESSFARFAPHLAEILGLKRELVEHLGYDDEPYDALLDQYEPGERSSRVGHLFTELREPLSAFVNLLNGAKRKPDDAVLHRHYPKAAQEAFARAIAEAMGFDFERGRLDVSTHPFCSGATPHDVRLTNRYNESNLATCIFGVMHEAGHGLYQQGLDPAHAFTPAGEPVSMGIHESQSRLWENYIGRGMPFWERFYPDCRRAFPEALSDVPLNAFVGAINVVRPSFIRVEADEVTYNLHIILRFELERSMISGRLDVKDVPEAWNAAMSDLLGIRPQKDADGCLQDIHWSMGGFGYFATYALGNLYAAQFFEAMHRAIPDLDDRLRKGDLAAALMWLRENIHRHGQRFRAAELVERVSGAPLSTAPFMRYLRNKFGAIYGV